MLAAAQATSIHEALKLSAEAEGSHKSGARLTARMTKMLSDSGNKMPELRFPWELNAQANQSRAKKLRPRWSKGKSGRMIS